MTLRVALDQLVNELDVFTGCLRRFASGKASIASAADFSITEEFLLEGVVSRAWQAWCNFCRSSVIESCLGATDVSGVTICGLADAVNEQHVSWAAIRAARRKRPYWGKANDILRHEPTWGDVDVLVGILSELRPSNAGRLMASLSSGSASAKALQTIRNASAHTNVQTMREVRALQSRYIVFPIGHPTHAMFWTEPSSRDFLVTHAIEELKMAGVAAVS